MKALKISFYTVMILFLMWFFVSWGDIVADNCFANPVHHQWNLFVLLFGGAA